MEIFLSLGKKVKLGNNVKLGNKVTKDCNVLSMECVTALGRAQSEKGRDLTQSFDMKDLRLRERGTSD